MEVAGTSKGGRLRADGDGDGDGDLDEDLALEGGIMIGMQKLCYSMYSLFKDLRSASTTDFENDVLNSAALQCSKDYRKCLGEYWEIPSTDQCIYEVACAIEMAWNLAEVFIIGEPEFMLPEIISWLRGLVRLWDCEDGDRLVRVEQLQRELHPEESDDFWEMVLFFVQRGELMDAWELLKLHSLLRHLGSSEEVKRFEQLFLTFPSDSGSITGVEYEERLDEWHRHLNIFRALPLQFLIGKGFDQIIDIFNCEEEALLDESLEWGQALLCRLLYSPFKLTHRSLLQMLRESKRDADTNMSSVMYGLTEGVMNGQVGEVIRAVTRAKYVPSTEDRQEANEIEVAASFLRNLCAFHLADLFQVTGKLNDQKLIDQLVLEYALLLDEMNFPLDMICGYIESCSDTDVAREWIRVKVMHRKRVCDRDAHDVIRLLRSHGLDDQCIHVCREMGMHWYKKGKFGKAAWWFVEGQDLWRLGCMCDKALISYMGAIGVLIRVLDPYASLGQDIEMPEEANASVERIKSAQNVARAISNVVGQEVRVNCPELEALCRYVLLVDVLFNDFVAVRHESVMEAKHQAVELVRLSSKTCSSPLIHYIMPVVELSLSINLWSKNSSSTPDSSRGQTCVFSRDEALLLSRSLALVLAYHKSKELLQSFTEDHLNEIRKGLSSILVRSTIDHNTLAGLADQYQRSSHAPSTYAHVPLPGARGRNLIAPSFSVEDPGFEDMTTPLPLASVL